MILDNEIQRDILIKMLDASSIPGAAAKAVASLYVAIETAEIAPNPVVSEE